MRKIIFNLRKSKKLTQAEVANSLGISRQHYARIESGDRNPSLSKAFEIKKFFNYYDDDIFLKEENSNSI